MTNPRKRTTIRISINYCCVPGKRGLEFVRSAELQSPPHKSLPFGLDVPVAWIQDFDSYHFVALCNPEVSGSLG